MERAKNKIKAFEIKICPHKVLCMHRYVSQDGMCENPDAMVRIVVTHARYYIPECERRKPRRKKKTIDEINFSINNAQAQIRVTSIHK